MLGTDVTYDDVLTRLKQAEIDSQLENSRQSKASVNKVQTQKRSSQCFCCMNPMHMVRNCPFYPGSGSWCLHCRDASHWTVNCTVQPEQRSILNLETKSDDEDESDFEMSTFKYVF